MGRSREAVVTKREVRRWLDGAGRELSALEICSEVFVADAKVGEVLDSIAVEGAVQMSLDALVAGGEAVLGEPDFDGSPTYRLAPV